MWEQVMWYVEHPNGIDALLCLALLIGYLRMRWPERRKEHQDANWRHIRFLIREGCHFTAAEEVRKLRGEEPEQL